MGTSNEEVASLDRVLTRLAGIPDDNLEPTLQKLLPLVINKLGGNSTVDRKVLEILSHVNKRIKGFPQMQLPLAPLIQIYQSPSATSMQRNFALVYIEIAVGRSAAVTCFQQVCGPSGSKRGMSEYTVTQR